MSTLFKIKVNLVFRFECSCGDLFKVCIVMFCPYVYSCMCIPCVSRKDTAIIVDDNCCQCNYAALQRMVEEGDVDVVYATQRMVCK